MPKGRIRAIAHLHSRPDTERLSSLRVRFELQQNREMFPTLGPTEVARLRRFGESYGTGKAMAKVGEAGHGLITILAGKVDVTFVSNRTSATRS
jgi:hypothetical protein